MKKTQWILTFSGKKIFPLEPDAESIDIVDIAHALSNICRFTGHCKEFYSVAQHSVHVAEKLLKSHPSSKELAFAGLLHDASEAYLCDIAKPVKECAEFQSYCEAEDYLQQIIFQKFGTHNFITAIKHVDFDMLCIEAFFLMPNCPEWSATIDDPRPYDWQGEFPCWSPKESKTRFLQMFNQLAEVCGITV